MKCFDRSNSRLYGGLRGAVAFALVLCILISAVPVALGASSVGGSPKDVTPDPFIKTYIKLSAPVVFFTGATSGTGATVTVPKDTVWQLVSENYYTSTTDKKDYYGVYYQNVRYNVLRSDVAKDIMTSAELIDYFTGTIYKQTVLTTLKKEMNLVGDVRVHALQYALSLKGYYASVLDGEYGDGTVEAVKKFQRDNGLSVDGRAGPITQAALYGLSSYTTGTGTTGGTTGTTGTTSSTGTLVTNVNVNLRKSTSTKSARLAVVPKKARLAYTDTAVSGGVTWYKVVYNAHTGWLMGSFVNAGGGSSSGSGSASSSAAAIGTVLITQKGTRVRNAANGDKTGLLLAKGSTVDLIATPVTAGGYTWYNIRTAAGRVGFVRGDCATATMGGGGGTVTPSTNKVFIELPAATALFTTETKPTSGAVSVPKGTVLQMVSDVTYASGGVTYCSLYYNNKKYNAVYDDVKRGIMSADKLAACVLTIWNSAMNGALKQELDLVGDVRVYAMQLALSVLNYYTGALDGNFGSGSASAVRNFQRKNKLTVDGSCGPDTWTKLTVQAKAISSGGATTGGGTTGGGTATAGFGTVNSVEMATWDTVNNGSVSLFKKETTATVMDVATGKVFTIYRWSGGDHADCVPLTEADTKVMCEIVGCPYTSARPTVAQLNQIKLDDNQHPWPDFKGVFGWGRNIGANWDRRPALLNVNGRVFAVSVYGFPHGYNGKSSDAFSNSKFPNGSLFFAQNNYYGMMCVHFVGSTTHTGTSPDSRHQAAIKEAYNYAKRIWPTLCR